MTGIKYFPYSVKHHYYVHWQGQCLGTVYKEPHTAANVDKRWRAWRRGKLLPDGYRTKGDAARALRD